MHMSQTADAVLNKLHFLGGRGKRFQYLFAFCNESLMHFVSLECPVQCHSEEDPQIWIWVCMGVVEGDLVAINRYFLQSLSKHVYGQSPDRQRKHSPDTQGG